MNIEIHKDPFDTGRAAGESAAKLIAEALRLKGEANIILATGASQFSTLKELVSHHDIDWSRVTMFHLDEYIGLPITAPASFRKYLKERFLANVPPLKAVYLIDGEADPVSECKRLSDLIRVHPIDVALVGIGENGHLAFNDPPADFDTEDPYIIVNLDEACRMQQLGEGWFKSMDEVPRQAISMSIKQIMKSKRIICTVPDERKAQAVKNCLENEVSNMFPASILQRHPGCTVYLDKFSAGKLREKSEK